MVLLWLPRLVAAAASRGSYCSCSSAGANLTETSASADGAATAAALSPCDPAPCQALENAVSTVLRMHPLHEGPGAPPCLLLEDRLLWPAWLARFPSSGLLAFHGLATLRCRKFGCHCGQVFLQCGLKAVAQDLAGWCRCTKWGH